MSKSGGLGGLKQMSNFLRTNMTLSSKNVFMSHSAVLLCMRSMGCKLVPLVEEKEKSGTEGPDRESPRTDRSFKSPVCCQSCNQ